MSVTSLIVAPVCRMFVFAFSWLYLCCCLYKSVYYDWNKSFTEVYNANCLLLPETTIMHIFGRHKHTDTSISFRMLPENGLTLGSCLSLEYSKFQKHHLAINPVYTVIKICLQFASLIPWEYKALLLLQTE